MQRLLRILLFLFSAVIWTFAQNTDDSIFTSSMILTRAAGGKDDPESCLTPNKLQGRCMSIFKCEELFSLYSRGNSITQSEKKSLQDAFCGWGIGAPHVCCAVANSSKKPSSSSSSSSSLPLNLRITPSSSSEQCGTNPLNKNSERIAGGRNSTLGAWPWMTALYLRNANTNNKRFGCGGSLIAREWVLTAAHCIPTSKSEILDHVRLGDLDIDPNVEDGANPVEVKIKEIIKHPKYSKRPVLNDIALLHLEKPVEYTQYIRPICLQSGEKYLFNETHYDKKKPVVTGWGDTAYRNTSTTHLLEVELNMIPQAKCNESYAQFVESGSVKLDKSVLCSYAPKKDSCQGDSGGPLMFIEPGGIWALGGIVSFGYECAKEGYPGVYTKVAAFIDWINDSAGLKF